MSPDEELLYRTAESIAFEGDTSILPLEASIATGELFPGVSPQSTFATHVTSNGEFYAQYLPLQPILAVPLIWISAALDSSLGPAFALHLPQTMTTQYLADLPPDQFAQAAFRRGFVVLFFNSIITVLSCAILLRIVRQLSLSDKAALYTAGAYGLCTMAIPHSRTFFTEPLAGLFVFAALDQVIRFYKSPQATPWKSVILAGLFLGLSNLTRVDSPFFTAGFVISFFFLESFKSLRLESYDPKSRIRLFPGTILMGSIAFAFWISLQLFNASRFGFDPTSGYSDQSEAVKFTTPLLVGLHGLLFSSGKGLFFFSPALALGVWGWISVPTNYRWLAKFVLFAYLPFSIAMATWQNWDGGWCWGPRHIFQLHLPIILGFAFLFSRDFSFLKRILIHTILIISGLVQIYGSSQNPLDYYQEYFQTFDDDTYHTVNLRDLQRIQIAREITLVQTDWIARQDADWKTRHLFLVSPDVFPAPMIDSIYIPQHTQWATYRDMWSRGVCDIYLVNLIRSDDVSGSDSDP